MKKNELLVLKNKKMNPKSKLTISLLLATIALTSFSNSSFAQANNTVGTKSEIEKESIDAKPNYDLTQFLNENLKYPAVALQAGVQGKVYVKFVVEIDGSISSAKVVKGGELGHGTSEEALRVITNMPKWSPGYVGKQAVRSYFTIPITFKIPNPNEQKELVREMYSIISNSQTEGSVAQAKVTEETKSGYDWNQYLMENLRYPREASEKDIQGKLTVEFMVKKTGDITDIKIITGGDLGGGLPEEAIRIVKTMPKWIPGKVNGISVDSYHIVLITFKLE